MTAYLLDTNILIALIDLEHEHHRVARAWFEQVGHHSWQTCPTAENGAVRVLSQPSYPRISITPHQAIEILMSLRSKGNHEFVPDSLSILDSPLVDRTRLLSSKQVTDTYLLALATSNDCTLVTLDRRLTTVAVFGGDQHVLKLLN